MAGKWMARAVRREGATRRRFGVAEDEKLPLGRVREEAERLKAKKGKLTIGERRRLRQDVLALTFSKHGRH